MTTRTDELLDEVAGYADRLADSDRLADTGSMTAAEVLAELFGKREWVAEWLEQKPIEEKTAYRRRHRVQCTGEVLHPPAGDPAGDPVAGGPGPDRQVGQGHR